MARDAGRWSSARQEVTLGHALRHVGPNADVGHEYSPKPFACFQPCPRQSLLTCTRATVFVWSTFTDGRCLGCRYRYGMSRAAEVHALVDATSWMSTPEDVSKYRQRLVESWAACVPTPLLAVLLHRKESSQRAVGGGSHAAAITRIGAYATPVCHQRPAPNPGYACMHDFARWLLGRVLLCCGHCRCGSNRDATKRYYE